jgi:dipeptidyl aminopeptidase/acylaminoacyl peptidase
MQKLMRTAAVLMTAVLLTSTAWAAKKVPVEDFFKRSDFTSFQLSPDGKYLAAISPIGQRRNIAVIDLATRSAVAVTGMNHADVTGFMWANNDRLLYFMDKDGNEAFGIFAVNKDGSRPKTLIEPPETQIRGGSRVIRTAGVINRLKHEPEYVLVSVSRIYHDTVIQDIKKMNILSGRASMVERNPGDIVGYLTNIEGDVIGAIEFKDGKRKVLYRNTPKDDWRTLIEFEESVGGFFPAWLSNDGSRMYVSSNVTPEGDIRDKAAIYRYDLENNKIGELIFEHDVVDVGGVVASELMDEIVFVTYNNEKPGRFYIDDEWEQMLTSIETAFGDRIASITSITEDEMKFVVTAWNSRNAATYYLYDRTTNSMEELGAAYDWLDENDLGEMVPVSIEARDGLRLPAFLTLPPGSEGKKLPMVVNPHGGPRARDTWGFRPDVQLMANRGYAVLQVNFRGSTGYGQAFDKAGWMKWGLEMQDDITDSVQWAIDEGIADPNRICIYGGSYGGYATMAGITFTPDLYQCAINYVGVTDIELLFETMPAAWRRLLPEMKRTIGDPKLDKKLLYDRSPINHVDKIKVPLFMAYGLRDPRVVIDHAYDLEKQLKRHEIDYELMVKKKEGHGYRKFENQVDFYSRLIDFLDENLKKPENAVDASGAGDR